MKNLFYIAIFTMVGLSSCQEHEKVMDLSLKIGNVYCMDGTTLSPEDYALMHVQNPLGVVVGIGGEDDDWAAIVMGLKDLPNTYIYADSLYTITGMGTDLTAIDGKNNTSTLIVESVKTPALKPEAAMAVITHKEGGISGWHLPSVAELSLAVRNNHIIEGTLALTGGEGFEDEWYHTSTIDGSSNETATNYNYCIMMPEGRIVSSMKNEAHKIRPFMILMKSDKK